MNVPYIGRAAAWRIVREITMLTAGREHARLEGKRERSGAGLPLAFGHSPLTCRKGALAVGDKSPKNKEKRKATKEDKKKKPTTTTTTPSR
jgi:hypothetical protein